MIEKKKTFRLEKMTDFELCNKRQSDNADDSGKKRRIFDETNVQNAADAAVAQWKADLAFRMSGCFAQHADTLLQDFDANRKYLPTTFLAAAFFQLFHFVVDEKKHIFSTVHGFLWTRLDSKQLKAEIVRLLVPALRHCVLGHFDTSVTLLQFMWLQMSLFQTARLISKTDESSQKFIGRILRACKHLPAAQRNCFGDYLDKNANLRVLNCNQVVELDSLDIRDGRPEDMISFSHALFKAPKFR